MMTIPLHSRGVNEAAQSGGPFEDQQVNQTHARTPPRTNVTNSEGREGLSCEIRDDLGPNLPTAAQDAEDRRLDRPAPSLPASGPLGGASVPPESPI